MIVGVGCLPIVISGQMMPMLSLRSALIILLNNLGFLFLLSSALSFVLWLDGGQRMRAELLFVRGI